MKYIATVFVAMLLVLAVTLSGCTGPFEPSSSSGTPSTYTPPPAPEPVDYSVEEYDELYNQVFDELYENFDAFVAILEDYEELPEYTNETNVTRLNSRFDSLQAKFRSLADRLEKNVAPPECYADVHQSLIYLVKTYGKATNVRVTITNDSFFIPDNMMELAIQQNNQIEDKEWDLITAYYDSCLEDEVEVTDENAVDDSGLEEGDGTPDENAVE
jgi:hypothetical protein